MTASAPLTSFAVVLPVWGGSYIDMLSRYGLPSLLSPGNLPAMAAQLPLRVFILTREQDRDALGALPAVGELEKFATVRVVIPPAEHVKVNTAYGYFSACYRHGFELVRREGGAAVLLTADQVWADGAMDAIARRILEGYRVVLVAGPRLLDETALPALEALSGEDGFGDRLDPRTMVRLACANLHPWDRSLFWDEQGTGRPASFLYWPVRDQGYLAHCLHLHPVCVHTGSLDKVDFAHTIDGGDFVERVAGSCKECYVVPNSDEVMYFSIAPAEQSAHLLDTARGDWLTYSNWCLSMGVSRFNLYYLRHGIRFCLFDSGSDVWAETERRAGDICARICRRLDKPHLLLYAWTYFLLDHHMGDRLRKSRLAVRLVKGGRRLVGLDY